MKVAQVLYSGLGGHGSVAMSFIQGDEDQLLNHQLIFYGIEATRPEYVEFANERGIEHRSILKEQGRNMKYWKAYIQALSELQPDVIILHSTNLIVPTLRYCRKNRNCKLINVEHQPNQIKSKAEWLWTKISLKKVKNNVYLTQQYMDELAAKFGKKFKPEHSTVINNGIDTNKFSSIANSQSADKVIFCMQARFSGTKDQLGLVKAFEKTEFGIEAELHFAGDGTELEKVKSATSSQAIVFHGMLNSSKLIALLNKTTIYVHASFGETMSTSVMQAMSMGLPLIGSDIPGISNLFEREVSGLAYSNEDELICKMKRLAEDNTLRTKLGAAARDHAVANFDLRIMFNNYLKLIQST